MHITKSNIKQYIKTTYGVTNFIPYVNENMNDFEGLLQNDYGLDQDCTLVSITEIIQYLTGQKPQTIYPIVENIAKLYGYDGNKNGTSPIVIRRILQRTAQSFGPKNQISTSGWIKMIGFNFNDITSLVSTGRPVILNLSTDGNNYYKNHSVSVIGTREYKLYDGRIVRMLAIKDHWTKETSYIDYNKLGIFCSINYLR